ncbi:MAG: CapA family protein [bacterium]
MAGDVVVTRALEPTLRKRGSDLVLAEIRSADRSIANLEIPLCEGGAPVEKLVTHRAAPALAEDLAAVGFGALVLANNHSCDYGIDGLLETMAHLRGSGITPIGAGRNLDEALKVHFIQGEDGAAAAVLAVSALLPAGCAATEARPGVAPLRVDTRFEVDPAILMEQPGTPPAVRTSVREDDLNRLREVISTARSRATHVIVYVHWGVGLQQARAEYQQSLGYALVDAGADLVVGCHPHAIQEIERRGDGYIFHNLGECFSQYDSTAYPAAIAALLRQIKPEGFLLKAQLAPGRPVRLELIPLAMDSEGDPSSEETNRVAEKILSLCAVPATFAEGRIVLQE